ncbi:MAG: cation-translocating P-type ATPase [Leptolyngbyaceae cyanobacterium MO_188.B28]|nr:cation-translocating P-type ATPase [Leptolyngbyaceae cyanobacterium MO_188.B28]
MLESLAYIVFQSSFTKNDYLGLLRGEGLRLMFLTAVSLGVAAVPEGLPTVVTIALALGAKRMLKRRVLIRKLPAVETLGSVTVICSDKTGTLTENRMTVSFLGVAGYHIDLTAHLRGSKPVPSPGETQSSLLEEHPALVLLLTGAALCNDALLELDLDNPQQFHAIGDPTEGALVIAAACLGLWKTDLEHDFPRIAEAPFDSERKRMTTVHAFPDETVPMQTSLEGAWNGWSEAGKASYVAFTKGAVDSLLNISSKIWINGHTEPLTDTWRERIYAANNQLAQEGMRILHVAFRPLEDLPQDHLENTLEQDLVFVGGIGMLDPARPEVKGAVLTCKTAGIRPVMITGDHRLTAQHIAHELGIEANGRTLTGQDVDRLHPGELAKLVESVSVYARVSPQHKLKIVHALQNRGHIVAMTGDGVNDAPALKQADIGVAMGITGTDVAKEAADMVLLDDNFATIVTATKEGRVIYDNIRKFIKYVLTGNSGELWAIVLALFWGMPLLLLPLQILWINLTADGLLALALSVEPAEHNVMHRPPYKPNESILSRGVSRDIIWIGLLLGLVLLVVGHRYWVADQSNWQTMVFSILAFSRMGLAQTMRSERDSLFRIGWLSNKPLLGVVVLTFGLQLAIIYIPALQMLFKTTALSITDLMISLMLSTIIFWAIELEKWFIRRR